MSSPPSGHSDAQGRTGMLGEPSAASGGSVGAPPAGADANTARLNFLEQEAAAWAARDKRQAAPWLAALGAELERGPTGDERRAARAYAQALTCDPSFQVTHWALRRVFMRRGRWDNLVRVLDAEARFAALPSPADRADLVIEKARVLEDRLGRDAEAAAAYRDALALAPDHALGALSLWLLAMRTGAHDDAERSLRVLVGVSTEPRSRALVALALARGLRNGYAELVSRDPGAAAAADALLRALAAGAEAPPLLAELDRLSLLAHDPELRLRALDATESHLLRAGANPAERPWFVATVREKARLLARRGATEGALAVLERGLRSAPGDPLIDADYLDAAPANGRREAFLEALGRPHDGERHRAEAALRQAEAALRAGALGEAVEALRAAGTHADTHLLVSITRTRVLTALRDTEALAQEFETEAGLSDDAAEAAHLLVRAATLRESGLGDGSGGEALYRRALELLPGFRPALEGLGGVFAREGRWADLVELVEDERSAERDPQRRRALDETLVRLWCDVLGDPGRALRALADQQTSEVPEDGLRTAVRTLDLTGLLMLRPGATDPEVAEARERCGAALEALLAQAPAATRVTAALTLMLARVRERAGAADAAEALYRRTLQLEPTYRPVAEAAAAPLEALTLASGRHERVAALLRGEAEAAAAEAPPEVARALRFRLAHHASNAGRWDDALVALAPLRVTNDALAIAWSVDIVRRAQEPELLTALTDEGTVPPIRGSQAQLLAWEGLWAWHEDGPAWASDVALARLRAAIGGGAPDEVVAAVAALGAALDGTVGADFVHEARASAASVELDADTARALLDAPVSELASPTWVWSDAVSAWVRALLAPGAEAPGTRLLRGLEKLEPSLRRLLAEGQARRPAPSDEPALTPAIAAGLLGRLGLRRWWAASGSSAVGPRDKVAGAAAHVLLTAAEAGDEAALILTTDLFAGEEDPRWERLRVRRAARLEATRSSEDVVARATGWALRFDVGAAAERAGQLQTAASAYAAVARAADAPAERPFRLEALQGLRRVARQAGARRLEAQALAELGALAEPPLVAAPCFAEAALILESEGDSAGAARLFAEVLRRSPDDEARVRLERLLEAEQDWPALEALHAQRAHTASRTSDRVAALHARATLRLTRTGDRRGAIDDLKRILAADPRDGRALRQLGTMALEDARFAAAVRLLERALPEARSLEQATELRLLLAEAHEGDGNLVAAANVLAAIIAARAEDAGPEAEASTRGAREQLVTLYLRQGDHARAIEQLRALQARAATPADAAQIELRVGRLARDHMGTPDLALRAFVSALQLDPSSEAAHELSVLVPRAITPSDEAARSIDTVAEALHQELRHGDPLVLWRLERLRDLAALRGRHELAQVLAQLVGLAGGQGEPGRTGTLRQVLPVLAVAGLGDLEGSAPGALLMETLPLAAPALVPPEAVELADATLARAHLIDVQDEPRFAWVDAARAAVGLETAAIALSLDEDFVVRPLPLPTPALVVGRGLLAGDAAARFRVGRALGLLRFGALAFADADPAAWRDRLAALATLAGARFAPGLELPGPRGLVRTAGRRLGRREARLLSQYASRFETEPQDIEAFREAARTAAERIGLLVAGDVAAAARCLAPHRFSAPVTADVLAPPDETHAASELVRFALSSRYLLLRRQAGLSVSSVPPRPPEVSRG